MPNQRKKSKAYIGGYYESNLKRRLKSLADADGVSLSELVAEVLEQEVAARGLMRDDPNSSGGDKVVEKVISSYRAEKKRQGNLDRPR